MKKVTKKAVKAAPKKFVGFAQDSMYVSCQVMKAIVHVNTKSEDSDMVESFKKAIISTLADQVSKFGENLPASEVEKKLYSLYKEIESGKLKI